MPDTKDKDKKLAAIMNGLRENADPRVREGMKRFGIPADNALGIPVKSLQPMAKKYRPDQKLAELLWKTEVYEARMLSAFVGDPLKLTPLVMDRWCRDFDSWALCDTLCMHLFDRSPHAWDKVRRWTASKGEFQKRAGLALLASLALHDKKGPDRTCLEFLPDLERMAGDDRNFVKKAASWALRAIGRRNPACP